MTPIRTSSVTSLALYLGLTACSVPTATSEGPGQPLAAKQRPADGMSMVYVPKGQFTMGSRGPGLFLTGSLQEGSLALHVFRDEHARHTVCLDPFWIDRTEVTVAMFRRFVNQTGYLTTSERDGWGRPWRNGPKEDEWPRAPGTDWRHPGGPHTTAVGDHPVVQVSWHDAVAYCSWAGASLPSEAQWELAARGTEGRRYPWGNTFDGNRLNSCDSQCPVERWRLDSIDDGYPFTSPVGSFPNGASPYGALDMSGNVWEWVADWYDADYYQHSPCWNPIGPSTGTDRVMRGGAWYDGQAKAWARSTVRHHNPAWDRYQDVGFRCVVAAPREQEDRCCGTPARAGFGSRVLAMITGP